MFGDLIALTASGRGICGSLQRLCAADLLTRPFNLVEISSSDTGYLVSSVDTGD